MLLIIRDQSWFEEPAQLSGLLSLQSNGSLFVRVLHLKSAIEDRKSEIGRSS